MVVSAGLWYRIQLSAAICTIFRQPSIQLSDSPAYNYHTALYTIIRQPTIQLLDIPLYNYQTALYTIIRIVGLLCAMSCPLIGQNCYTNVTLHRASVCSVLCSVKIAT